MHKKTLEFAIIFIVIFGWIFGYPPVYENFWWVKVFSRPPILSLAQEATTIPETTTLTPETATSTSTDTIVASTPADNSTSTPAASPQAEELALPTEISAEDEEEEEEEFIEETLPQPEPQPAPQSNPVPYLPLLKERKFTKMVRLNKDARHSCAAKSFTVDLSGRESVISELELSGTRSDFENIEIGSLPLGIDITFLSNADYTYAPPRNDNSVVLQIVNQPGSQKGNFSIPIIYTSDNSTTICQINVINF